MSDRIENPSFHLKNSLISLFIFSQIFCFLPFEFMHFALSYFENPRSLANFQQKCPDRAPEGGHWQHNTTSSEKSQIGP